MSALESTWLTQLVHLGYGLMLCALIARDVLWLRSILVLAQGTLAVYAWDNRLPEIAAWNVAFVAINTVWVLRILRERRALVLPEPLRGIHQRHFAAFSALEFLRFWKLGAERREAAGVLVVAGQQPQALMFLVEGQAEVIRDGRALALLPDGSFIGEMSLVTDAPASADVRAQQPVLLHSWPIAELHRLRARQPQVWTRLQSAIGHDLVEKIRRQSATG